MSDFFVRTLTEEEKIIFLRLFCKLIKSDGVVDEKEIDFLKTVANRYQVKNEDVVKIIRGISNVDYVQEAKKITERSKALQLIKELCLLANVDHELSDEELDMIIEIADLLNIEENKVIQINRWVLNSLILAKVGHIILEEKDE